MKRALLYLICLLISEMTLWAQAPLSAYHNESFVLRHELNPAFQPDSDYLGVPLLGSTSMGITSTLSMGDLLYDRPDGTLTTFMSNETLSKADLLDRVGGGMRTQGDVKVSLLSLGRRRGQDRYQTYGLTYRVEGLMRLSRGLFECLKDVSNGSFEMQDTRLSLRSWVEAYVGESRRMNDRWTLGGKAKLLLGVFQANLDVDQLRVDFNTDKWTAEADLSADISGMKYTTETAAYKGKTGSYERVKNVSLSSPSIRGLGLAVDLGATCQVSPSWQLSASLLDAGFLTWFSSQRAENTSQSFVFDGFQNATISSDDENSISNQMHRLEDSFADVTRLRPTDSHVLTQVLRATTELGASYQSGPWMGGVLLTAHLQGNCTWLEGRLNVGCKLSKALTVNLSPAYSNYGRASVGALATYTHPAGYQVYLGSDALFWNVNRQLIPISMHGALQFGATLPF